MLTKFYSTRLPVPWFLYTVVFGTPIQVSSEGLGCSIILLFTMLILVFGCILCSGWKMSKLLGISMFGLYFMFVAVSLAFEYKWWPCPVWMQIPNSYRENTTEQVTIGIQLQHNCKPIETTELVREIIDSTIMKQEALNKNIYLIHGA